VDFTAAILALDQCGINGPVTFNVAPGTYNEQLIMPWISGTSAINTIVFKSANNDSTSVTLTYNSPTAAANYLLKLQGAEHITFKNIKFQPSNATFATAVQFTGGAKYNKLQGNYFVGQSGTTNDHILVRNENVASSDNLIVGNRFDGGSMAIYIKGGNSSSRLDRITIKENYIDGFSTTGIKVEFVNAIVIDGNVVSSAVPNSGTKIGIQLLYSYDTTKVTRNHIIMEGSTNTHGIQMDNCSAALGLEGLIANNFIIILNGTTQTYGMRILNTTRQKIYHNSLNVTGVSNTDTRGINTVSSSSNIYVLNNNVSSNKYPTLYEGSSCARSNYNNLYSTGNLYGYFSTTYMNFTSLDAYKLSAQKDTNSISVNPFFVAPTDLHTFNGLLNGVALPVSEVTVDIDNEPRDPLFPDMGADEFIPSPIDATVLTIAAPLMGCAKTSTEQVTMIIKNVGTGIISTGLAGNFRFNNSPTIVTEQINTTILPGDTFFYTFNATVNMDVTAFGVDSIFKLEVWSSLPGDFMSQNDSVTVYIESYYTPPAPVATNTAVTYGQFATLTAISNDSLFWFTSDTATVEVFMGSPFITPPLYDTTTYYVSAGVFAGGTAIIGNGTIVNPATSYPAVYGNWYWGAKHQMLIPASELIALGMKKGNITSVAFDVTNVNACPPLSSFEIRIGSTSVNALTTAWEPGLVQVFSAPVYQAVTGWNTHTFSTPFFWDGASNLIIESCFNNSSYLSNGNASMNQSATPYASTHFVYNDAATVCSAPAAGQVISQRPNMRLGIEATGCQSAKVPLTVFVTGFPTVDAGIVTIVEPVGSTQSGIATPIKVELKNYGLNPLTSVNIIWKLNSVIQDTFPWSGNLLRDSIEIVTIDTMIFAGGVYCIDAYTNMPNMVPDTINSNDTANICFNACMAGVYTIGPAATGTYNYNTFNSALSDLVASGICGHVVFDVYPGTYSEQLTIPQINGMNINNTVTFRGVTGDSTAVILQYTALGASDYWTIRLNGADWFRFEKMTIKGLGASYARAVEFQTNAENNIISNCVISVPVGTSSLFAPIYVASTVNHDNQILNNVIQNGYYGIYWYGSSTANLTKRTVIQGNIIQGFYYYGAYLYYFDSLIFNQNTVRNLTGFANGYGVFAGYCQNLSLFTKNKIELAPTGTVYGGIYITDCTGAVAARGLVANNFITIAGSNTTGVHYGLRLYYSNYYDLIHNSVNLMAGSNTSRAMEVYAGSLNNVLNNYARNTSGGYAYYVYLASNIDQSNHNNFWSSGTQLAYWAGINYGNLTALQTASLKDANSHNINVPYISTYDLHLLSTNLSGKGLFTSRVPDDIDGEPRAAIPTIGADEVPLLPTDAGVIAIITPGTTLNEGQIYPVEVTVINYGTDTIFSMNVQYTVNNGTPVTAVFNDTLVSLATKNFVLPSMTAPAGNSTICAKTLLPGDTNYFNDEFCKNFFGIPVWDAQAVRVVGLENACNIGLDTISVWVRNLGVNAINSPTSTNITMSYKVDNLTPVTQNFTQVLMPGDSVLFHFTTLADFSVTTATDTFNVVAWVNLQGDNVQYNDTAKKSVISYHVPASPVVTPATVPYASPATLTASSPTNDPILWFNTPTGGSSFHTGTTYTTPILYTNTTYYLESSTLTLVPGSFLSPNAFTGGNSCGGGFMIDITALTSDITITALDMNLTASGAQSVPVFYRVGTWQGFANNQSAWIPWGTYSVNSPGTNQATNMVINPLTIPQGMTYSIYWQVSSAYASLSSNATYTNGDISVLSGMAHCTNWDGCCTPRGWNGRIYYNKGGFGCGSPRVPLQVTVSAPAAADVGVSAILQPTTAVNLGATETVIVKVKNYGTAAQSNIPVSFKVDNQTTVTETIAGPLAPGDSLNYTFVGKANLALVGNTYQFKAWTSLAADNTHLNDTAWKTVQNLFPSYCISTATSTGYEDLTNVTLHTLNNTSAAVGSMYTNFSATVPPPVLSPGMSYPISISSGFPPSYSYQYSCWVKAWIDFDRDGTLDPVNEIVFSSATTSSNTVTGTVNIPPTAMSGNTLMRVVFVETSAATSVNPCGTYTWGETEDYMITISPQGACDAGITAIVEPGGTTAAGAVLPIKVVVMNFGSDPIAPGTLSITYTINNGTPVVVPYAGGLPSMGKDTVTLGNMTAVLGYNTLCVKSILACDTITFNDEKCVTVFGNYATNVPYFDDFEGTNYWYKPDASTNWQYGTPAANIINTAYSGTKSWVTKLAGNYTDNANEHVYSPIFDFTGLSGTDTVTLSFYHWQDMQSGDYGRVQYSTDGGTNWSNLGFFQDTYGTNWYNVTLGGLHYFSTMNTGWQYSAYKLLPGTFNIHSDVRFRFNFVSNTSGNGNGWAIDNFKLSLPMVPNDVGVTAITYPINDTAIGSVVYPKVTITNFGSNPQVMFPVVLKLNGAVVATETWTGNLPSLGTTTYTFLQPFTVPSANYQLCAETQLSGDAFAVNNGKCQNFAPQPAYHDVGIVKIVQPLPDSVGNICFYHAQAQPWYQYQVIVKLHNPGQYTQTSVPVKYTFSTGGTVHTDTWTGTIAHNDTVDVVLTNLFLPALGAQQLCVEADLTGDPVTANNKTCLSFTGKACIGIDDPMGSSFELYQNVPNPASGNTMFGYRVPQAGDVTFGIVSLLGQVIHSEVQTVPAGERHFDLDVSSLAAGVYYYFVEFNGQRLTKKLVIRN
jgi:hypothetical protein